LGQKPVLSSHAHASKPASLGYAAEIETMDEANVKPKPDLDKPREKFDMEAWKKRQAQMLAETQASLELARKTQELERERIAKNEAEKAAKAAQIKADLEARAAEAAAAKAAADEEAAKLEAKRLKEEAIAQEAATAQQKADQEAAEAAAAEKAAAEKAEADKQAALVG
jgi:membrane protein involved in colicin uptake